MIVVEFPQSGETEILIKVHGHSGKSEKGEDVVCAAVSALVQTLAGGIQDSLQAEVCGRLEPGNTELRIKVEARQSEALRLVCNVFRFGFQKICESYPEHVKLI